MSLPWQIAVFLVAHWVLSVFFQSFFLHRYGAHRMFSMSPRWERIFHLATFLTQGASYLNPRGYAILHRMHHAYADTDRDPHSPVIQKNPFKMMSRTWAIYSGIRRGIIQPEARFEGGYPDWPALDRFAHRYTTSVVFGAAYTVFYVVYATEPWHFVLVPIHYLMGPIHGAIVNWFGHWLGYRNFDQRDDSRNTLIADFVTMGELFQNNHHKYGSRPNFAVKWFEIDPTWWGIVLLQKLGIITLRDPSSLDGEEASEGESATGAAAIPPPLSLNDAE